MMPARRYRFRDFRSAVVDIVVAMAAIGGVWVLLSPYPGYPGTEAGYPGTELDRKIAEHSRTVATFDITYLLERYLPADFDKAVKILRDSGFGEGSRTTGASYRRRPPADLNEAKKQKTYPISMYNRILDEDRAVALKRFWRITPAATGRGRRVEIFLLTRKDGRMKVVGFATGVNVWLFR